MLPQETSQGCEQVFEYDQGFEQECEQVRRLVLVVGQN
jgi:hypothetical protein